MVKGPRQHFRKFNEVAEVEVDNHEEVESEEEDETIEVGQTFNIVLLKKDIEVSLMNLKESQEKINKILSSLKKKKDIPNLCHTDLTEFVLLPEQGVMREKVDLMRVTVKSQDAW